MSRNNYSALTLLTLSLFITLAPLAPLQAERYMGMPLEDQLQLHTHADLRKLFSLSHTKASTQLPAPLLISPKLTEVRPQINIITEYMSDDTTEITPLMIRDRAWLTKEFKELFHPALLAPQKKHIARLTSLFGNIIAQHPESFGFIKTITPLERFDSATRKKLSLKLSLFARLLSNRKHIPTQVKKAVGVLIAFFQTHLGVLSKSFWKKYKGLIIGAGSIAAILGIGALYKWHKSKQEKTQPSTQPGRQPLTQADSSGQSVSQRVQGERTPGSQVSVPDSTIPQITAEEEEIIRKSILSSLKAKPGSTTSQATTKHKKENDTLPNQSLITLTESIFSKDSFSTFRVNERDKPTFTRTIHQSMKEHFNLSSDAELQALMERIAHINDMLDSLGHSVSYKGNWETAPGADAPTVSFKNWYDTVHKVVTNGTGVPYADRQEPTAVDIQACESELETVHKNSLLFAKLFGEKQYGVSLSRYKLKKLLSWNLSGEDQRLLETLNRESYVTGIYSPFLSFDMLEDKTPKEVSDYIKETYAQWITNNTILKSSVVDSLIPESSFNPYGSQKSNAAHIRRTLEEEHKITITEETLTSIARCIPIYNARFTRAYGTGSMSFLDDLNNLVQIYKEYKESGTSIDEAVCKEMQRKPYIEKVESYGYEYYKPEDISYLMEVTKSIKNTDKRIEAVGELIEIYGTEDKQTPMVYIVKGPLENLSDANLPLVQRIAQIKEAKGILETVTGKKRFSWHRHRMKNTPGDTVAAKIAALRAGP